MTIARIEPMWCEYVDPKNFIKLERSGLLSRCRNGEVSKQELYLFLEQHNFYSKNFVRFLCAVMANIDNKDDINLLIDNLFDEAGFTGLAKPHSQMYEEMLVSMGLNTNAKPIKSMQNLTNKMKDYCHMRNPIYGLSALALGAEALVPYVYSIVLQGLGLTKVIGSDFEYFKLHISCDEDHAKQLYNVLNRMTRDDPLSKKIIEFVAVDMIVARSQFFDEITEIAAVSNNYDMAC